MTVAFHTENEALPPEVLVVDDEPYARTVIARFLGLAGYRVREADNVPQAREQIARALPRLVFLDINMPGPSGLELLEELAPSWPDVGVILSTALGDVELAMEAIRSGAADFVHKPVTFATIKLVASRTLERQQLLIENRRYQMELEALVAKKTEELRQRTHQLLRTQAALVQGLCRLTEFRDPATGEHLDRMGRYAQILARNVSQQISGLRPDFAQLMQQAAPLHDIGKVGVPDAVLFKPHPLDPDEYDLMKRHTVIGAEALTLIKKRLDGHYAAFLDIGAEICLGHHERWDGEGYPFGLRGETIPLSARIASVADYFDACMSSRIYRTEPLPYDEVREAIVSNAGKAFDPRVVQAFLAEEEEIRQVLFSGASATGETAAHACPS